MNAITAALDTMFRSITAVLALQILARINGAKQISQLSFYDYITGITIGSMAAVMAIDDQVPFWIPLLSMIVFVSASYAESKWTIRSIHARKYIDGMPTLLMADGKLLQEHMRKAHLTVNDLLSEARVAGYFNLSQISFAIMENSGKISFLPFPDQQPVSNQALAISVSPPVLSVNVIIDGVILERDLVIIEKDIAWLNKKLKEYQVASVQNVLLAIADRNGNFHVYLKDETSKHVDSFL